MCMKIVWDQASQFTIMMLLNYFTIVINKSIHQYIVIGQFQIVQQQKNRVEVQGNN